MAFELQWFPFYVKDFLTDATVNLMDHAAVGVYVKLLCHQWLEGSIPSDKYTMARLLHIEQSAFDALWPQMEVCFVQHVEFKDRLINERMEAVRAEQQNKAERARQAGRKGGLKSAESRASHNGRFKGRLNKASNP